MNKGKRIRLLKSKLFTFPIFLIVVFLSTYFLSSALGKAKPIEQFTFFISGIDFDYEVLRQRIKSFKTEKYNYLLVFEAIRADENSKSEGYSYDYRFLNEAVPNADIIIYSQSYFEETYSKDAYSGHFNKIKDPDTTWTMENEYALKIHDKLSNPKDNILGITFKEDNYFVSINNKTVHDSEETDAARHFIEAFIHD